MRLFILLCLAAATSAYRATMRAPMSMSLIKRQGDAVKNDILTAALATFTLGGALAANAAVLTAEERELQQNQKPNANDVAQVFTGKAPDWAALRKDIAQIVVDRPDKGPTLVRLAWHASGTYDKMTSSGGSGKGTIRFSEELSHGANAGLDLAVSWLDPIYKKYNKNSDLSYADLYTLAGVVAIQTMKGPSVAWRYGRQDSFDPADVTPDGRLPEADRGDPTKTAEGLRKVFYRMGFDDREIVALSGAHSLGRCHATASGYVGPWSPTPTTFNNLYFSLLKSQQWTVNPKAAKLQYQDPSGKLMMLPSDLVLLQDDKFKTYVDAYAKDNKLFFADFSAAFSKLLELGTSNLFET